MSTIRIAILGPECSGKSTLVNELTKHLNAQSSEEYARAFLNQTDGRYSESDLDIIAEKQYENNKSSAQKFFIADTEILTVKIWSMVKYGRSSEKIKVLLKDQFFDLYLLCKPDIPWEADPLREHPNERGQLFDIYEEELKLFGFPYQIIQGKHRLKLALNFIDNIS